MAPSPHEAHARFRFSVIGPLLTSPPPSGELHSSIAALAERSWKHPVTGSPTRYSFSTIERWYYTARDAPNPVEALRRSVRSDVGRRPSISSAFHDAARALHQRHPDWTFQLHHDNLRALVDEDPSHGPLPSYPTFVRFMKRIGLTREKRRRAASPARERARERLERREVRSFELDHVGALWHVDFHTAKRISVLDPRGIWQKPHLVAFLDDHSRLCCHAQFYLSETTEDLAHALSQAILKRGLPRSILSDNGPAMIAEELTEGLHRLSIEHQTTLAYSPHQNGKQEHFWAVVEGRLMAMLQDLPDLSLEQLNDDLQAWVEVDYHRRVHSEIKTTPLDRYRSAPSVLRSAPGTDDLRNAFRRQVPRKPRRTDATFSLEGTRFEIPARYRHLPTIHLQYARWDLSNVHLVDERTGKLLCRVLPLDKSRNSSGQRRSIEEADPATAPHHLETSGEVPPLLRQLREDYAATGLPPSYLPKTDPETFHAQNGDE